MDTARAVRSHIIWTSLALILILIASCLTYVFMSKVHGCQTISTVNASAIESMFSRWSVSREQWLLRAWRSNTDNYLIWEDEWHGYREHETILDRNNMSMTIREKGVYLVYIQVNFQLNPQNDSKFTELKILVEFSSNGQKQLFSAAHDTQMVSVESQDAKLNTFLLMKMQPTSQLSVKVYPREFVIYQPRPFSSFITIIKWADNW